MRFLVPFIVVLLIQELCHAQINSDSIVELEEVIIEPNRFKNFKTGDKIQKIDSATRSNYSSNNLGELLSQQTNIYIKSYGPGNLASISTRGTNPAHTPVLWNGFNIQGPTLGQLDFSLFPISFAEDVQVQFGGTGALFGSGGIGGVIHLNNSPTFNNGLQVSALNTFSSLNNINQSAILKYSRKKFSQSIKFFNSSAKNDFKFINSTLPDEPLVHQSNSSVTQRGIMIEDYFSIGAAQVVSIRVWAQDNDRQIPPIMTNTESKASLKNKFLRVTSEWTRTGDHVSYFVRAAHFRDQMNYSDPIAQEYTKTFFTTTIAEAESNIFIGKRHLLNAGISNTYDQAISEGFSDKEDRLRTSVFASYKISDPENRWKGTINARQEMVSGKLIPFTPSVGIEATLKKGILISGNVSRNYRIPTFNDLYWIKGGNPDLMPEYGWSEELSLSILPFIKWFKENKIVFTLYNSNLTNYLMWLPSGSMWTATNVSKVWARGLETNLRASKEIGKTIVSLSMNYSYVLSTNEQSRFANDESLRKQLIYVPIYNAQGNFSVMHRGLYANYIQTFTGNVFTTTDNTEYLKGYLLGNFIASKSFQMNHFKINLNFKINNIWNQSYQVVLNQAMPLRYYQIGLSVFFHQPTKLH